MHKFITFTGMVVPIDRANIDTDQIIPKQYLKSIEKTGFGETLFDDWRYLDNGEPGMDHSKRKRNPDFVLNLDRYKGASTLLTRANFGCGSSREHAPWALLDYGFKAIIAPSFADIFYNNSINNGLLPISLSDDVVEQLFIAIEKTPGFSLEIDLEAQQVITLDQQIIKFNIDPSIKYRLLNGLDEIGLILQYADKIKEFEKNRQQELPWMFS